MSETSGAGGKKGKVKVKPIRSGIRGWDAAADGANLSRTISFGSPDEAMKGARRALGTFQKAGRPIEVRLEGSDVTLRVGASAGQVDDELKKLTKRVTPKDPAAKAARKAKAAAAAEG